MSTHKKTIIAIDALTIRRGGGQVLLSNLALALAENKSLKIHLLCNPGIDLGTLNTQANIDVIQPPKTQSALGAFVYRQTKLDKHLDAIDPDCTLITFNAWSASKHKQITIHINTIPFLPFKERVHSVGYVRAALLQRASRKALQNSCLNIFESQYLLDIATSSYNGDIRAAKVRHFGTDLPRAAASDLVPQASRKQQLITVSSGAKHKQNHKVILAFAEIKKRHPELELLVVGNEALIKQDIAQALGEQDVKTEGVRYAGYLTRDELTEQLASSRALISLSTTESFYLVAIEAMFCGTPVIVKRIASAEESCGKHALLLDDDTADAVADAYEQLQDENTWQTTSEQAHAYAAKFEARTCMKHISDDIYEACKQ